jgi:ribosomal protein L37AE/L43A
MTVLPPASTTPRGIGQAPHCEECEVALKRVGAGSHRYWTCPFCGSTVPAE